MERDGSSGMERDGSSVVEMGLVIRHGKAGFFMTEIVRIMEIRPAGVYNDFRLIFRYRKGAEQKEIAYKEEKHGLS
ncbi:MAG: hypothetical protein LKM35_05335 [Lachnospiraceae bacterium]|jgi:hypothetical protein|nr:hypothetical protein [Lachnospiraceae bacterium]MCI1727095.1 hypothetical protein [Lachnospiraceae bacterium]